MMTFILKISCDLLKKSISQAESEQVRLLKFEIELLQNETSVMSTELNDLKAR